MLAESHTHTDRYAKCIANSARVNWDIDRDVLRARTLEMDRKFLPDGLSNVADLGFLDPDEARFFSQVQGRTYANMFGLVERFICASVLDAARDYRLGQANQTALAALVQFSAEELKHQELFRRLDRIAREQMPPGYVFVPDPDSVAELVLGKSKWSVLGLTLLIELFTQVHYRESIAEDQELSPLWKDVFLHHWKEESQHAILDELEWKRENGRMSAEQRDAAVDDLIALVHAVDGLLHDQAKADAEYFIANLERHLNVDRQRQIENTFLKAYRWQYVVSGVQIHRFTNVLGQMIKAQQSERIFAALAPLIQHVCV